MWERGIEETRGDTADYGWVFVALAPPCRTRRSLLPLGPRIAKIIQRANFKAAGPTSGKNKNKRRKKKRKEGPTVSRYTSAPRCIYRGCSRKRDALGIEGREIGGKFGKEEIRKLFQWEERVGGKVCWEEMKR